MTDGPAHARRDADAPAPARTTTPGSTAPAAPVPLAPAPPGPEAERPERDAGCSSGSPLARLRREDAPATSRLLRTVEATSAPSPAPAPLQQTRLNLAPQTLDQLLACSGVNIQYLAGDTSPTGPLRGVLVGAFEADWFRAKSCLVFGKWPGGREPRFPPEYALRLMTALTEYRGAVHKAVMPLAQQRVKQELAKRAEQLKGNERLASALTTQQQVPGVKQVEYKGSVGADSVTSDVDVSTGGINSEVAVRAYNEAFRSYMGLAYDPGTVFDLNVYAKDFIHGFTDNADKTVITPKTESEASAGGASTAVKPSRPLTDDRDREQDIWALVHVARYMPADADWKAYVDQSVEGLPEDRATDQRERLATARRRAVGFEWRLLSMMEHLGKTLDLGLGKASSWAPTDDAHFKEGALRMRAANKLYEDKLLQVKELRLQIQALGDAIARKEAPPKSDERLERLVAALDGELSMAQLYANEVYGSGGATVHAVMGMQMPKKLSKERGSAVTANIPKQQWYAAFTDNLGDVLKDFEHYGKDDGHGTPDHWYAAFKMGKYANRMVDAVKHLSDGAADDVVAPSDQAALLEDPRLGLLETLATWHVKEKDLVGGTNPAVLADHEYFGAIDARRLAELRKAAVGLGATVRSKAAAHSGAAALPERPVRAEDITADQLERARADVQRVLGRTRAVLAEVAGPGR